MRKLPFLNGMAPALRSHCNGTCRARRVVGGSTDERRSANSNALNRFAKWANASVAEPWFHKRNYHIASVLRGGWLSMPRSVPRVVFPFLQVAFGIPVKRKGAVWYMV